MEEAQNALLFISAEWSLEEKPSMAEKYELPGLPYPYDGLVPVISREIVTLHHDKHHQAYVSGANAALEKLEAARKSGLANVDIRAIERDLAFNVSGHKLHALYWQNMKPNGGGTPGGKLADQIVKDFGGFDSFKAHMGSAAKAVEGSGWGLLVYDAELSKLLVLQVQNHQNLAIHGAVPLLTVDVWEHAYYLDYKNLRADYVDKWWNVVNWDDVQRRFEKAKL